MSASKSVLRGATGSSLLLALLAGCTSGAVVSGGTAGQPAVGAAGVSGAAGTSGSAGTQGPAGTNGAAGMTGAAGVGAAGTGTTGRAGTTGAAGVTGAAGANADGGMKDAGPVYDVPPPPMAARGATVPWLEYEAEAASTNGVTIGPDRAFGSIPAESSGRRAVRLESSGQYVELTSTQRANALVVRYVIPDSPGGDGMTATLNVYVDGAMRQALSLTSKYAWSYGGEDKTSNAPGGGAHHFYDEARALIGDVPPGAKVKLQKDAANTAAYYVIDLVDLEYVPPPLEQPAGSLSLGADCGAMPDDGKDDGKALQTCTTAAHNMGKVLWIGPGTWDFLAQPGGDNQGVQAAGVTVRGAGVWHTTLRGPWARFHLITGGNKFQDFSILGDTTTRDDMNVDNGFNGGAGAGSRLENIWVEHTKVAFWVGAGGLNVTNGLVITGCRFRNLFADGVNFCNGTSNSEVVNTHLRNTGDDALASWAPAATGVNTNNVFHFNTVQVPWRANCFGLYGGKDNRVEDNVCADVVTYPGILVAQQFTSQPFTGTTTVQRNSFIRAGGRFYNSEHGAIKILSQQGPISGLLIKDILIDAPTFSGIHIEGGNPITNATFDGIMINDAGSFGILVRSNTSGGGTFSNVDVARAARGGLSVEPSAGFNLGKGAGNTGW
jgi:hypothetical protein